MTKEAHWTIIEKKAGRGSKYPLAWQQYPCLAVTRNYLSLNPKFVELLIPPGCLQVMLMYQDGEYGRLLGIKPVPRGEENPAHFNLSSLNSVKGKYAGQAWPRGLKITANATTKSDLADLRDTAYRAHRNPASQVIEVDLSPENRI